MKFSKVKQFLKSKKVVRVGACVLAAIIVAGGTGAYHVYGQKVAAVQDSTQKTTNESENDTDKEENILKQVLKSQTDGEETTVDKEETVYVVADPDGTPNEVIVSDWLKNHSGAATLEDVSDLKDIENVKGDETFTQGADGALTWQADGNDIYYQGTTDKELPIDMKMTYYLDGKEISPEDLAGKSGKVTIRMDYTNKEKTEDGVYVPFTAVTGMMLNKNFTNVEVTNGKVVSDGNNQVVVGFAFPGLSESLDLDSKDLEDIEIPDYVEVTADVEDFSLDMTMTFVMSDILQELDVDQDIDLSGIEDAIDSLSDASNQLVDGSKELADGTGSLVDGVKAYTNGVSTLKSGIGAYTDGVSQVKSGVDAYTDGVAQVAGGTKQLADKSGDLKDGITQLVGGAMQIQTYFAGDDGIVNGAKKLSDGVNQLDVALNAGVTDEEAAQAETAAKQTVEQMFGQDTDAYKGVAQQAVAVYSNGVKNSTDLSDIVTSALKHTFKQINPTLTDEQAAAYAQAMSQQLINSIADNTSASVGQIAAESAKSGAEQGAIAGAKSGIASTKSVIAAQIEQGGLVSGAQTLSAGVQKLYNEGIEPLAVGMQSLNNSVPELMKGIQTLNNGAATLNDNSAALKSGVNTLNSKGSELNAGAATLDNNSGMLNDGAAKLNDGAKKLSDGMIQFDEEGIQKLSDAYHGDVEELLDRVDQVLDAGASYHTFSGLKDDMSGSVKFVIRTEAIETK